MKSPYPRLPSPVALRQVGKMDRYLMNARNGDYFRLDEIQMEALRNVDGARSIENIADSAGMIAQELEFFFQGLADQELLVLEKEPSKPESAYFRACDEPHLSDALIEVTGQCNLECYHCYNADFSKEQARQQEMTTQQVATVISEMDALNVRRLQLSGGEALMRKDLWQLLSVIDDHRIFLDVISTNAHLINTTNVERFAGRFQKHGALYISMDGLDAHGYESVRGPNTFDDFMAAMNLLGKHRCRMFINTMAVRPNLDHMEQMYEWMATQPSVMGWRIGLPKVLGRYRDHHQRLEVPFSEVIQVFKRLLDRWLVERPNFRLELSDFFRTDSLDTGLEDHSLTDNPCKYAMSNITIKPDGTALFCASLEPHEPAVLGNVVKDGLPSVWYGQRHADFRRWTLNKIPECGGCRYRRLCGGGCRSNALLSYGRFDAKDPRSCAGMEILEHSIMPLLPEDFQASIRSKLDVSVSFDPPSGYQRYI